MSIIVEHGVREGTLDYCYKVTTNYLDGSATLFTHRSISNEDYCYTVGITPSGVIRDSIYPERLADRGLALA